MADDPSAVETDAPEAPEAAEDEVTFEGDFDPERAKATILKQRQAEKALKARLAEAEKDAEELAAIKKAAEDAEKTAEQKLAEAEAKIKSLQDSVVDTVVKADFIQAASDRGYTDPGLAYLAAKEQGLLGAADPKTGTVSEHDFETLEATHQVFQGGGVRTLGGNADAGRRSPVGKTATVGQQFNAVVREALNRR